MMTRKDFNAIAAKLKACRYEGMDSVREAIHADYCLAVAYACQETNPRFNMGKFLEACGAVTAK